MPRLKSLETIILAPVATLLIFAGVGFYFLISGPVEEIVGQIIKENLSSLSRAFYREVDFEIDRCNIRGLECRKGPQKLVAQLRVFERFEDITRQDEVGVVVYELDNNRMSFSSGDSIVPRLLDRIGDAQDVYVYGPDGEAFYARSVEFKPWNWRIVLLKGSGAFSILKERVRNFSVGTGLVVLLLAGVLAVYLRRAIGRPINQLISDFREQKPPEYKGISEFEFLSDNIGQMMHELAEHRDHLEELVATRTAELERAQNTLTDALESITEGFSLYDADDRLVLFNSIYREIMLPPGIKDYLLHGTPFESIVRTAAQQGLIPDAGDRIDEWVADRLEKHRNPSGPHLQQRGDGRWVQISERKTETSGTVAVYMDVTELKLAEDRANAEWLRVQKELQSAHELQLALLPRQFPLPTPERPLTFAAKWTPSGEVTGDFYDVFEVGEHRIGIVIGDATGHDVGAALFMARAFTILKTTISRDRGPGSVLMQLNNELVPGNESFMFATVFYGVFDIKTGVLTYANAGHLPPYLFGSDRNLEQLSAPGALPVGVRLDTSYVEKSVNLVPGDALFCYSDGITEAKNPSHKEFSDTNLATVLKECVQFPAEDVINHVFDKVSEFTDHAPPFDDMTCVAMRYLRDGENPNTKVQRPN